MRKISTPVFCTAFLMCFCLSALNAQAQVYKWIDKDGKVQYSDSPPPGTPPAAAQKLELQIPDQAIGPAKSDKGESWQEKSRGFDRRRVEASEKQAKEDAQAQKNEAGCNAAKANLRDLQEAGRVFVKDEKGDRQFLDEEQRKAEVARVQGLIAQRCR